MYYLSLHKILLRLLYGRVDMPHEHWSNKLCNRETVLIHNLLQVMNVLWNFKGKQNLQSIRSFVPVLSYTKSHIYRLSRKESWINNTIQNQTASLSPYWLNCRQWHNPYEGEEHRRLLPPSIPLWLQCNKYSVTYSMSLYECA